MTRSGWRMLLDDFLAGAAERGMIPVFHSILPENKVVYRGRDEEGHPASVALDYLAVGYQGLVTVEQEAELADSALRSRYGDSPIKKGIASHLLQEAANSGRLLLLREDPELSSHIVSYYLRLKLEVPVKPRFYATFDVEEDGSIGVGEGGIPSLRKQFHLLPQAARGDVDAVKFDRARDPRSITAPYKTGLDYFLDVSLGELASHSKALLEIVAKPHASR